MCVNHCPGFTSYLSGGYGQLGGDWHLQRDDSYTRSKVPFWIEDNNIDDGSGGFDTSEFGSFYGSSHTRYVDPDFGPETYVPSSYSNQGIQHNPMRCHQFTTGLVCRQLHLTSEFNFLSAGTGWVCACRGMSVKQTDKWKWFID